jgi:hypothetical protein
MSRHVVYDAKELAQNMRRTFADRPIEQQFVLEHPWPEVMQNVGDSLAVAYGSDKWKKPDADGRRPSELYKHIAESRNRALVRHGLLRSLWRPGVQWDVIGPSVNLASLPMPAHFALLGLFEEIDLQLHVAGTDESPEFGPGPDDGIVKVTVRHGMLGASAIRWSEVGKGRDEPFLFVYTESDGVLIIVVGEKLRIAKDGVVG